MPGKQRRRNRKQKRTDQRRLPPERLLAQARQSLMDGDPRKALELLRRIPQKEGAPAGLPLWLFCACVERARQLNGKGLAKEAAAMGARAAQHRAEITVETLADEDLIRYLRCLEGGEALQVYAEHLARRPPLPTAERALADRLVIDRCWERVEHLAVDHPLRQDAPPVRRSVDAMDSGDWERAARLLAGVARRSPFAPWRLLCKAMACFAAGDEHGLQRAVDLMPEDFALSGTVAELRRCATGAGPAGPDAVRRTLGTGTPPVAASAAKFRQALDAGIEGEIERHLIRLAEAVYPEDPVRAQIELLMIVSRAALDGPLTVPALGRMARRILPGDRLPSFKAQAGMLAQEVASGDTWDPVGAEDYLDVLPVAFPCRADQAIARSCVLESLARAGVSSGIGPHLLDPEAVESLTTLLGKRPEDPAMMVVDLMMASLAADPESPTAFRFLLDVLRSHPVGSGGGVRDILAELAERHPEDPDPWLEMATLDYSRNAYRRAQTALAEARRRAPYDERILDLQAVGFLKSADQSCRRGRFALAEQDLQRAADLQRRRLEPGLRVKRLLLDVIRQGGTDVTGAAAPHLRALAPCVQMRTLVVAIHDLQGSGHVRNVDPEIAPALRQILALGAGAIGRLEPDEALDLIADLPSDYRVLYGSLRVAPVLADWWEAVMARLDGDRLIAGFDTLLACGGRAQVRAELDRRLCGRRASGGNSLLRFYLAVILYQDREDYGSGRFADVLDGADSGEHQRLRAAAMRLARVADQPLRHALQRFDFKILDHVLAPFPAFWDDILPRVPTPPDMAPIAPAEPAQSIEPAQPVEPEPPEPEVPAAPEVPAPELMAALRQAARDGRLDPSQQGLLFVEEAILAIVDRLELMIDGAALRGAPPGVMQEISDSVRADTELRRMLDELADWCATADRRDGISPELAAMLFAAQPGADAGRERR